MFIDTLYKNNPTPLNQAISSEKIYNSVSDFLVITSALEKKQTR